MKYGTQEMIKYTLGEASYRANHVMNEHEGDKNERIPPLKTIWKEGITRNPIIPRGIIALKKSKLANHMFPDETRDAC